MTLAVATHDPRSVAETYVRQHMRLIMPGNTVGIGLACSDEPANDLPFFCVRRSKRFPVRKLNTLSSFLRTGYSAGLSLGEEHRLAKFLRAHKVTALLAEFGTTGCALRLVAKREGIPIFVNFHGLDATVLGQRRTIRYAYRLLAQDAQRFFCGSRHFADVLVGIGIPHAKIDVVPCGIELDQFTATSTKNENQVIAIGRLTRKKRPDLAIRAFAVARQCKPDLKLDIIGDGPERGTCERTINQLGLKQSVTLVGAQSHAEVKKRLRKANIFVQHSVTAENGDQESQGISLVEAMASGVPVVTTDHNGFSETVSHGKTGLLSPEMDVEAMGQNLQRLASDPALAREMGTNGRRHAETYYDAHRLARRLRDVIFSDVLSGTNEDRRIGLEAGA
ncbi:MAG: glycosyltransferase [Pseudomonadota bacterium]